jgi:argininosuccinate lyase
VKELEDELEFRSKHFKHETEKLKQQNKMLQETGSISKKEAKEIRNAEKALQNEIERLRDENKSISLKLQQKEMEAAISNRKVIELSELLSNSNFIHLTI